MNSESINEILMKELEYDHLDCQNNNTHLCALIDSFGYVIASNQDNKYTGRFIGERIGPLVDRMNMTERFKIVELRDTQAQCSVEEDSNSAGNILLTPAKMLFGAMTTLFSSVYWLSTQLFLLLVSILEQQNHVAKAQVSNPDSTISCTMMRKYYVLTTDSPVNGEQFSCPECLLNGTSGDPKPNYALKKVPGTNVFLLIAFTGSGKCGCFDSKVLPRDAKIETDWCTERKQKYRKGPSTCYNETKLNHKEKCGSAANVYPSLIAMVLTACLAIYTLHG